ncbi:MAG: hypothetical protein K2O11_07280, partial [Oscillospiraceae bacterium]|nr:hypothetical protein [Oscillospiraceae bacterium]
MMKRNRFTFIFAALLILLTGCRGQKTGPGEIPEETASPSLEETVPAAPETISFTDDLGREVAVNPPTRV